MHTFPPSLPPWPLARTGGYIWGYENDNIDADELTFRPSPSLLTFVMHQPEFDSKQALAPGGGERRQGHSS